jgi:hypothetical protein
LKSNTDEVAGKQKNNTMYYVRIFCPWITFQTLQPKHCVLFWYLCWADWEVHPPCPDVCHFFDECRRSIKGPATDPKLIQNPIAGHQNHITTPKILERHPFPQWGNLVTMTTKNNALLVMSSLDFTFVNRERKTLIYSGFWCLCKINTSRLVPTTA